MAVGKQQGLWGEVEVPGLCSPSSGPMTSSHSWTTFPSFHFLIYPMRMVTALLVGLGQG